jgi:hypothetical protein
MVTKADAQAAVEAAIVHLFQENYSDVCMSVVASIVVDRLTEFGITTRTIKAAFNTPKRNEGEEN